MGQGTRGIRWALLGVWTVCTVAGSPVAWCQSGLSPCSSPAALNTNAATDSENDFEPHMAMDGAGRWVAVWNSYEPDIGSGTGADQDILVARSTDNGVTWTSPAALYSNAATDSGHDMRPQVATDGTGNWVTVWSSNELNIGSGIGTDYDVLVSRSSDNGVTWSSPATLNTNAATDSGEDYTPQLTTDGAGNWVATWSSDEPNIWPGIGEDTDILVSRSTDNGATWTTPVFLNSNAAALDAESDSTPNEKRGARPNADSSIRVATDGAGNWVAVWDTTEPTIGGDIGTDHDVLVSRSTDNGATWTESVILNTNAAVDIGGDYSPQVTTDNAGNWVVVWYSREPAIGPGIGTDSDIIASRSSDNGATWTPPALVNAHGATDFGYDSTPELTTDGSGDWVVVWASEVLSLGSGIGADGDILVSRSTDNGATWAQPATFNTNAATDSEGDFGPRVNTDGAGNWIVTWNSDEPDIGTGIGDDYDILMSRSTDLAAIWTVPWPTSVAATSANPTSATSVDYVVTFDWPVTGVDSADFSLVTDGIMGAGISSVTPLSDLSYLVSIATGFGDGSLRLDLVDEDSIMSLHTMLLGGPGAGNGDMAGDITYNVDKAPASVSIGAPSRESTASGPVNFVVTYVGAETVLLDVSDVTLNTTDTATGSVMVSGSGFKTRLVTVSGITGTGTIGISIGAGTASDWRSVAGAAGPSTTFAVTGGGIQDSYTSTDVPVAVWDSTTITSTIDIPALGAIQGITDVNVTLDIAHTRDGDLEVYLASPQGRTVELFTGVGGSGNNFTNTTLDDSATTAIASGAAPFTGSYRPEGNLSDFTGQNSIGTWTLTITDTAPGDEGTLIGWSLQITGTETPPLPVGRLAGLVAAAALLSGAGLWAMGTRRGRERSIH